MTKEMNISGDRQTGKTTAVLLLADKFATAGSNILFIVENGSRVREVQEHLNSFSRDNITVVSRHEALKGLRMDVIIYDGDKVIEDYYRWQVIQPMLLRSDGILIMVDNDY